MRSSQRIKREWSSLRVVSKIQPKNRFPVIRPEVHFEDSAWESCSSDPAWGSFRRFSLRIVSQESAWGSIWRFPSEVAYKLYFPSKPKSNWGVVTTCSSPKNMYEAQKWNILEAAYLIWRLGLDFKRRSTSACLRCRILMMRIYHQNNSDLARRSK